ncbi:MAG: hypothetical protein ACTS7E_02835 [Arsenophonus sp. NC-CH8-MAG3]
MSMSWLAKNSDANNETLDILLAIFSVYLEDMKLLKKEQKRTVGIL